MKIFYTASFYGKSIYQKNYDLVLEAIESFGHIVISPEKNNYLDIAKVSRGQRIATKNEQHYLAIKNGIRVSDAVIIEVSYQDLQLGHEATLAIQNHKPVLCLSILEDFSKKIIDPYFFGAKYNEYIIYEILEAFIKQVTRKQYTERFNMFLTPAQLSFINKKAKKTGRNVSSYIRNLIDQDQDEENQLS